MVDHWSNFASLMREDPFLAMMYGDRVRTGDRNFRQANQNRIMNEFFGGNLNNYNQWVNSTSAGGSIWNQRGGNAMGPGMAEWDRLTQMLGSNTPYMAAMAGQQGPQPGVPNPQPAYVGGPRDAQGNPLNPNTYIGQSSMFGVPPLGNNNIAANAPRGVLPNPMRNRTPMDVAMQPPAAVSGMQNSVGDFGAQAPQTPRALRTYPTGFWGRTR